MGDNTKTECEHLVALGQRLRCLMTQSVASRADLPAWYAEAQAILSSLKPETSNVLPQLFWHWLSDADIRFRDHEYAKVQDERMARLVAELEHGRVP